jgi:outer membrane cobalamin receptor
MLNLNYPLFKYSQEGKSHFSIVLLVFAILSLFVPVKAESTHIWHGRVIDTNGNPIPYVVANNINNSLWAISDEEGRFTCSYTFEAGDSVQFSRIGFEPKTVLLDNENLYLVVTLSSSPILLNKVIVSDKRTYLTSNNKEFVSVVKSPELGDVEYHQLLSTIPGLSLRSYGGPAGIKTVSLDGNPTSQTKVVVNGFDLTNAQNGEIDLSQLPMPFIDNVIYIPQDDNYYGSGSIGSTIQINPWFGKSGLSASLGSYGHTAAHGFLNIRKNNLIGNFLVGRRYDEGDYKYEWKDKWYTRDNNTFSQNFLSSEINALVTESYFLNFFTLITKQERGVAGQIWSPNNEAERSDELQVYGAKFGWSTKTGYGYAQVMYRYSWEHYKNPDIAINSIHRQNTLQSIVTHENSFTPKMSLRFLIEGKLDFLNSKDAGRHSRESYGFLLLAPCKITNKIKIQPSMRYDLSPDLYEENSYSINLEYKRNLWIMKSLTIQYGKYFRYPTFNDLYWSPGGNPDLNPEHTQTASFRIDFNMTQESCCGLLFFCNRSNDLIQWSPLKSYWQPLNIKKAEIKGGKLIYQWKSSLLPINLFLHYTYSLSKNLTEGSSNKKQLRYAPVHVAASGVTWTPHRFSFNLQVHYTGERIAMYSWPEDVILPDVLLLSTSIGYRCESRFGDIIFSLNVDNLTGKYYETIKGYPEPGRSLRVTISYYH